MMNQLQPIDGPYFLTAYFKITTVLIIAAIAVSWFLSRAKGAHHGC